MAQQNINIGSSANKGDGDPIRIAFTKVNANFTELYAKVVVLEGGGIAVAQDIQGDIFAQDSSLGYSSATNTHYGSFVGALDGDVTGSVFGDDSTVLVDGVNGLDFADLGTTPTTLAGYGITDAATSAQGVLAASALQAETITLTTLKAEVAASTDFADYQTRIAAL